MKKYEKFINVKFSYNGDLGKLQYQSKLNIQFAANLCSENIITDSEYYEVVKLIGEYIKEELTNALSNIVYTLS